MYGSHIELIVCPECEEPDIEIEIEYVGKGTFDPDTYAEDTQEVVTILDRQGCTCPSLDKNIGSIWNNEAGARWERQQEARMEG